MTHDISATLFKHVLLDAYREIQGVEVLIIRGELFYHSIRTWEKKGTSPLGSFLLGVKGESPLLKGKWKVVPILNLGHMCRILCQICTPT